MIQEFPRDFHPSTYDFITRDGSIWKIVDVGDEYQLQSADKTFNLMKTGDGRFTPFTKGYKLNINLHGFAINGVTYILEAVVPNDNYVVPPEPEPTPEDPLSDLKTACDMFRVICYEIGDLIDNPNFRGGFDELLSLNKEQQTLIRENGLNDRINLVDRLCNHEANKLGLQAPAWWYRCWGLVEWEDQQQQE